VEIAKFAGFNSPQLAALGLNLSFTDTPWLAAGKFINSCLKLLFFRPNAESLNTTGPHSQQFIYLSKIIANFSF
jgi:hypothetical protein